MSAARAFDPANDQHFAIPQDVEYQLRQVARACSAMALLYETLDPEQGGVNDSLTSAMFDTIGFAIGGAIEKSQFVTPRSAK